MKDIEQKLVNFAQARDWQQFHSPKNLSMALAVEASELMEHFQWLTEEQSDQLSSEKHQQVKEELADVFLYSVLMANRLGIDLEQAAHEKIQVNEQKYPAERVKGSAKKYHEYD